MAKKIVKKAVKKPAKKSEGKLIGKNSFVPLQEIVKAAKSHGGKIVLNLGDSSTSGWNSDMVAAGGGTPFFTYKTYSDILSEKGLFVINAGVPGYTSLQGKFYLKRLLSTFEKEGIISLIKPQTPQDKLREQAMKVWLNYKNKKSFK